MEFYLFSCINLFFNLLRDSWESITLSLLYSLHNNLIDTLLNEVTCDTFLFYFIEFVVIFNWQAKKRKEIVTSLLPLINNDGNDWKLPLISIMLMQNDFSRDLWVVVHAGHLECLVYSGQDYCFKSVFFSSLPSDKIDIQGVSKNLIVIEM